MTGLLAKVHGESTPGGHRVRIEEPVVDHERGPSDKWREAVERPPGKEQNVEREEQEGGQRREGHGEVAGVEEACQVEEEDMSSEVGSLLSEESEVVVVQEAGYPSLQEAEAAKLIQGVWRGHRGDPLCWG